MYCAFLGYPEVSVPRRGQARPATAVGRGGQDEAAEFQSPEGGRLGLQPLTRETVAVAAEFQSPEGGRLGLQRLH